MKIERARNDPRGSLRALQIEVWRTRNVTRTPAKQIVNFFRSNMPTGGGPFATMTAEERGTQHGGPGFAQVHVSLR